MAKFTLIAGLCALRKGWDTWCQTPCHKLGATRARRRLCRRHVQLLDCSCCSRADERMCAVHGSCAVGREENVRPRGPQCCFQSHQAAVPWHVCFASGRHNREVAWVLLFLFFRFSPTCSLVAQSCTLVARVRSGEVNTREFSFVSVAGLFLTLFVTVLHGSRRSARPT